MFETNMFQVTDRLCQVCEIINHQLLCWSSKVCPVISPVFQSVLNLSLFLLQFSSIGNVIIAIRRILCQLIQLQN
jgi:hypothetical protein